MEKEPRMRDRQVTSRATLAATMLALSCAAARAQTVVASWIEMGPGSSQTALSKGSYGDQPTSLTPTILARAVVSDGVCPSISLDGGAPATMSLRFSASTLTNVPGTPGATNDKTGYPQFFVSPTATTPGNFPNGTAMATTAWGECESVVPAGHVSATIGTTKLKLPVANPKRFLLLADTGCRLNGALASNGSNQQNCSSPTAFPLAYLASYEATFRPDLIVHVGDWFYRDTNCLTNGVETFPGCNTPTSPNYEPWGDIFDSWNADVFYPMKPLLEAAPFIMVRGNHESCGRGARGWYALLDPRPYSFSNVACAKTAVYPAPTNNTPIYNGDFEPTYVVPANNINFLVHDSSYANDSAVDTGMAQNYDLDLTNLLASLGSGSMNIFTTHKPSFGLVYGSDGSGTRPVDNSGDFTEQSVFGGGTYANSAFVFGVPPSVGLFLSGHIHQAQFVDFKDYTQYAPQLIVGVGGSLLDPDMNTGLVPGGNTDVPNFDQRPAKFVVNTFSGANVTALAAKTASHDEFGFAVLEAITDSNGRITGFNADIYKSGLTKAGFCKIDLSPRKLNCNF
jgi:hypothetical protein